MHVGNMTPPEIIKARIQMANVSLNSPLLFLVTKILNKSIVIYYLYPLWKYLKI